MVIIMFISPHQILMLTKFSILAPKEYTSITVLSLRISIEEFGFKFDYYMEEEGYKAYT